MNKSLVKRLSPYLFKNILFYLGIILQVIQVLASLYSPIIIGKFINDIDQFIYSNIKIYILWLIILTSVNMVALYLSTFFMSLITNKMIFRLRKEVFNKIVLSKVMLIDNNKIGDLLTRLILDVDVLGDGLLQALISITSSITTVVMTLVFMFRISFNVSLVVVFLTPLSILSAYIVSKLSKKSLKLNSDQKGNITSIVTESFDNINELKQFSYEDVRYKIFSNNNLKLKKFQKKASFASSLTNPLTRLSNNITLVVVFIYASIKTMLGIISVGDLQVFVNYCQTYAKPFNDISSVSTELSNSYASFQRIFYVIDFEIDNKGRKTDIVLDGNVKFLDVCFSYKEENPLIKNFNLDVKKGMKVAIVGPTGAGKSTMINLLLRFYNVSGGSILIDNININDLSLVDLRSNFGLVLQESFIFTDTIYNNVCYGTNNDDYNLFIKALKDSNSYEFVSRLKNKENTVINKDIVLSEGEKQLLSIARIMLKNPNMLILDEATSNIDVKTEENISNALDNLIKGKTTFIIAHRLQTITNSDLIIVMDKGEVKEIGTHNELLLKQGLYKEIYDSQFSKNENF